MGITVFTELHKLKSFAFLSGIMVEKKIQSV